MTPKIVSQYVSNQKQPTWPRCPVPFKLLAYEKPFWLGFSPTFHVVSAVRPFRLAAPRKDIERKRKGGKMVRRKIEIELIANTNNRQVAFSKRRQGLMKKANELAICCDVDVGVVVFSSRDKVYEFSSSSMERIFARYNGVEENVVAEGEVSDFKAELTMMRRLNRRLTAKKAEGLNFKELQQLEHQFAEVISILGTKKEDKVMLENAALREQIEELKRNYGINAEVENAGPDVSNNVVAVVAAVAAADLNNNVVVPAIVDPADLNNNALAATDLKDNVVVAAPDLNNNDIVAAADLNNNALPAPDLNDDVVSVAVVTTNLNNNFV